MHINDQIAELPPTKRKLVDASVKLMRAQGYNATTVDDICSAAGVTKGGFFHYFKSKEDIAQVAINYFRDEKRKDFEEAPFRRLLDPLDRVYGRLEFVKQNNGGAAHLTKGCLIGMLAQELAFTHPEFRKACQDSFLQTAGDFEKDIAEAKSLHAPQADFNPKDVAMLYVSIVQGSLVLAKTSEENSVLLENLEQFRRYLQGLFGKPQSSPGMPARTRHSHSPRAMQGSL